MEILGDPTNTRMFSFNKNTACIQSGLCLCDAEQKQQQKKRFLTLLLSIFEQSLVLNLQHLCEQSNISRFKVNMALGKFTEKLKMQTGRLTCPNIWLLKSQTQLKFPILHNAKGKQNIFF